MFLERFLKTFKLCYSLLIIWVYIYLFTDLPEVQKFSFQEDIIVGKRVSATCLVSAQTDLVSFRWLKNNKEVTLSKSVKIKHDQEFSVLIIDPVSLQDEGNYTCIASNSEGSGKYTAHLSVKGNIYSINFHISIVFIYVN